MKDLFLSDEELAAIDRKSQDIKSSLDIGDIVDALEAVPNETKNTILHSDDCELIGTLVRSAIDDLCRMLARRDLEL